MGVYWFISDIAHIPWFLPKAQKSYFEVSDFKLPKGNIHSVYDNNISMYFEFSNTYFIIILLSVKRNYLLDKWIALNKIDSIVILFRNLLQWRSFFECLRILDAWFRQEMSIHWNRKISFFSIVKFLCNWEIKKLPSSCYE